MQCSTWNLLFRPLLLLGVSLGFSLALAAHRRPIRPLSDLSSAEDTGTLAMACLALDHTRGLSAFGVAP